MSEWTNENFTVVESSQKTVLLTRSFSKPYYFFLVPSSFCPALDFISCPSIMSGYDVGHEISLLVGHIQRIGKPGKDEGTVEVSGQSIFKQYRGVHPKIFFLFFLLRFFSKSFLTTTKWPTAWNPWRGPWKQPRKRRSSLTVLSYSSRVHLTMLWSHWLSNRCY